VTLREIELPSEELAEELQRHLKEKRLTGTIHEGSRKTIQFPENMNSLLWSSIKGTVEKWGKGRNLQLVESLKLQPREPEPAQERADPKELQAEVKKKLDSLTPQSAEERYNYLQSKPLTELSDAEIEERLALAQRKLEKS
jgi:hypothetical protein